METLNETVKLIWGLAFACVVVYACIHTLTDIALRNEDEQYSDAQRVVSLLIFSFGAITGMIMAYIFLVRFADMLS